MGICMAIWTMPGCVVWAQFHGKENKMPGWNILQWIGLVILILLIGLPLWICEKLTGKQPERIVDFLDRRLTR